ncbi:MAG: hypothetical protein Q4G08_07455 [Capnocytophaga sp.]|nr:hypothetical protein [Capnocytophaga sp.]
MKIQLHPSTDTVKITAHILTMLIGTRPKDRNACSIVSIVEDIHEKFAKKALSLQQNHAGKSKKTKIALKFHECIYLERCLADFMRFVENEYHRALLQNFLAEINQKTV